MGQMKIRLNAAAAVMAALMLALALGLGMPAPVSATDAEGSGTWVYVDGSNGDDANNGGSAGEAVKSWGRARELLGAKEGGIRVCGTVEASGPISTQYPNKQKVRRAEGFTGVIFFVVGEAIFHSIDVDGEDKRIDAEAVQLSSGSKVSFLYGAIFRNIGYVSGPQALPDNTKGGRVVSLSQNVKILVDGATFRDNDGKGIFFAPLTGGSGGGVPDVQLVMKSGRVTGNKGYFYHNEAEGTKNDLRIYNALVRNNDASSTAVKYTNYSGRTGVIYVCSIGVVNVRSLDGAAFFGNKSYDVMQLGEAGQGIHFQGVSLSDSAHRMLGGGNPQWSSAAAVSGGYYGYRSDSSQEDRDKAAAAATSILENNQSALVDSNGRVTFGRFENETPPETPAIPEEPKEDDGAPEPTATPTVPAAPPTVSAPAPETSAPCIETSSPAAPVATPSKSVVTPVKPNATPGTSKAVLAKTGAASGFAIAGMVAAFIVGGVLLYLRKFRG